MDYGQLLDGLAAKSAEYVDNKATAPMSNAEGLHNYRYVNDSDYKGMVDWESAHQHGLKDASLDVVPAGLGLASSATKAGQVLSKVLQPAEIVTDIGRREAMKTMGLGTVAAGVAAKKAVPSLLDAVVDTSKLASRYADGINLKQLADDAGVMKQISSSAMTNAGKMPTPELQALKDSAATAAKYLEQKYQAVYPELHTSDFYRAAHNDRFTIPEEVKKAMSPDDFAEFEKMVQYQKVLDNADEAVSKSKELRNAALSTKKPVLDLDSLVSERARTTARLEELKKAPDHQEHTIDSREGTHTELVPNANKINKSRYLTTRLDNIDAQIDALSKTGKIEPFDAKEFQQVITTPKGKTYTRKDNSKFNQKGYDNEDLFAHETYQWVYDE